MDIIVYLLVIPLAVYTSVRWLDRRYHIGGNHWLLLSACALFSISLFLPSPIIDGEDTEFYTHLLGGGVFSGLIWLYLKPLLRPKKWHMELLQLFALVSAFGVVNELFELLTHTLGLNPKSITDTSWDLLANTFGALVFYGTYRIIKYTKGLSPQR